MNELARQLKTRDSSVDFGVELETVDDNLPTEATYDIEWENDLLEQYKRDVTINTESDDDTDAAENSETTVEGTALPGSELNYESLLQVLLSVRNFALVKDSRYLQSVEQQISMTEDIIVKMKLARRQTALSDFFI